MDNSKVALYKALGVFAIFGLILSLIGNFFYYDWAIIINAIFKIFLVIILFILEFAQTPFIVKGFSFMFYFLGRGVFYIILGFITIGITIISLVGGILMILVGIVYVVLHFTNSGYEPEYMSFSRYQRLTNGASHDLPTAHTAGAPQQNAYPMAHQSPLPEHVVPGGQYNTTHTSNTHISSPASPLPVHTDASSQDKTEV